MNRTFYLMFFLLFLTLQYGCRCYNHNDDKEVIKGSGLWQVWEILARDDALCLEALILEGLPVNNLYSTMKNFKRSEAKKHFGPDEKYSAHPLLMLAATCKATACMDVLVKYGTDVSSRSLSGTSALFACAFLNGADSVKWASRLLEHPKISVNDTNFYGETPLVWAIRRKNVAMFDYLINRGAKYDSKFWSENNNDYSWFLFEAANSSPEILKRFLDLPGVDPYVIDSEGRNALFFVQAEDEDYEEKIRILVEHGIDINTRVNPETIITRLVKADFMKRLTPERIQFLREMGISEDLIREGVEFARQHGNSRINKIIKESLDSKE